MDNNFLREVLVNLGHYAWVKGYFIMSLIKVDEYRVEVPFLTSHIPHLNASGEFLYVQTEQSQMPSSIGFWRFVLYTQKKEKRT